MHIPGVTLQFSHQHGFWPVINDSDAALVPCIMGTEGSLSGMNLETDM